MSYVRDVLVEASSWRTISDDPSACSSRWTRSRRSSPSTLPGTIGVDWGPDLQEPIRRDVLGPEASATCSGRAGSRTTHPVVLCGNRDNWLTAYGVLVPEVAPPAARMKLLEQSARMRSQESRSRGSDVHGLARARDRADRGGSDPPTAASDRGGAWQSRGPGAERQPLRGRSCAAGLVAMEGYGRRGGNARTSHVPGARVGAMGAGGAARTARSSPPNDLRRPAHEPRRARQRPRSSPAWRIGGHSGAHVVRPARAARQGRRQELTRLMDGVGRPRRRADRAGDDEDGADPFAEQATRLVQLDLISAAVPSDACSLLLKAAAVPAATSETVTAATAAIVKRRMVIGWSSLSCCLAANDAAGCISACGAGIYNRSMEAVILCGVQGSGKTTLYRDRFLETHVRVSMDLLRTRAREAAFLKMCLETRMLFVVDNTNPTVADRARYVAPAREAASRSWRISSRSTTWSQRPRTRRAHGSCPPRACATLRGGSSGPRRRRASTSSGTPPRRRKAAGGSSRCSQHRRCSERVVDRGDRVVAQLHVGRGHVLRTCSGRVAPTITAETFGRCSTQASASWVSVIPASSAIGFSLAPPRACRRRATA